jgi:hypothetical protein
MKLQKKILEEIKLFKIKNEKNGTVILINPDTYYDLLIEMFNTKEVKMIKEKNDLCINSHKIIRTNDVGINEIIIV